MDNKREMPGFTGLEPPECTRCNKEDYSPEGGSGVGAVWENRRFGVEIEVERCTPRKGNWFRFRVRVARAGEGKLREILQ